MWDQGIGWGYIFFHQCFLNHQHFSAKRKLEINFTTNPRPENEDITIQPATVESCGG